MKQLKTIMLLAIGIFAMVVTSCGGDNTKDIDAYVAANNSTQVKEMIQQSGIFSDYECKREGNDIVCSFTYLPGVDLSGLPDDYFKENINELINPIRNDYNTNEVAKKAIDAMKAENAAFKYIYTDANGVTKSVDVPASEI